MLEIAKKTGTALKFMETQIFTFGQWMIIQDQLKKILFSKASK